MNTGRHITQIHKKLQVNLSPLYKMAAILAAGIFQCIFLNENDRIQIQILLKFGPKSPINNKAIMVQAMPWRHPGEKLLPDPEAMLTLFTDMKTS